MSCLTSSLRKVSSTSSRRSISRWARSRSWRISRSPPSRTLRRTSDLAPSASSSARSASSFCWRASTPASRRPPAGGLSAPLLAPRGGVAPALEVVLLRADLGLDGREVAVARLVVDRGDQVGGEVDDLLEVLGR